MLTRTNYFSEPVVADRGDRIYKDLYQRKYEKQCPGRYMVIDVITKRAYVAGSAETAIAAAWAHAGDGVFHLVRIASKPNAPKARLKLLP